MRRPPTVADASDELSSPAGPGLPAAPDRLAVTEVLRAALRSEARAASERREHVERARHRMAQVQLDDAQLLEGIATSLLADSGAGAG